MYNSLLKSVVTVLEGLCCSVVRTYYVPWRPLYTEVLMENFAAILIPILLLFLLLRLMALPLRWFWKLSVNSACGFASLVLLNSLSGFTGLMFPVNAVTALIAGFLGLPGIAALAVVQLFL
jgi:inhibitor of the pro-sigma K processing machinery